jgi:hypothetical protein
MQRDAPSAPLGMRRFLEVLPCPETRIRRRARPWALARYAIVSTLVLSVPSAARAQDTAFCDALRAVIAAAPDKFRALRSERFDRALDSFESDARIPGFETCRVDALQPAFYCMAHKLSDEQAASLTADTKRRVAACLPDAAPVETIDMKSPIPRLVTEWSLRGGRQIRLVRRDYPRQPGSVYLYVR